MDTITVAILSFVSSGIANVAKSAVLDAYEALKRTIIADFGKDSQISNAITAVEMTPSSKGRQMILSKEIAVTKASQNAKIIRLAQQLMDALDDTEADRDTSSKFRTGVSNSQVGVMGDHAHVEGGIHFFGSKK